MSIKLTKLDDLCKKVIYLLSINSRESVSTLSKLAVSSRRKIKERIKKLYDQKFIFPKIKITSNGATAVFIRLNKFDEQILKNLKEMPTLTEIKECLGYYDISFVVLTKNYDKLNSTLVKIEKIFHKSIVNMDILYETIEYYLGYRVLLEKSLENEMIEQPIFKNVAFEKKEKIILEILKESPLANYRELSKRSRFSYITIKRILKNIKEKGVIFTIGINPEKMNMETNEILIKIKNSKKKKFEEDIINNKNVVRVLKGNGRWDYVISICSTNLKSFTEIVRDIRTKNRESLRDFNILLIRQEVR